MRVAVITPYYQESDETLQRCTDSVRNQSVPADHFLVADGWPNDLCANAPGARHIQLETHYNDYGATPRRIGFLIAVAEFYDAIAFLDADHWMSKDHVEQCLAIANGDSTVDMVIPQRSFFRDDGTPIPVTPEEIDDGFLDSSCHFLFPGAFGAITRWGTGRKQISFVGDERAFLFNLSSERLNIRRNPNSTIHTTCLWESIYRFIGEEPPSDSRFIDNRPIWLLGDGRSGTTWFYEILNHHSRYRTFFEPFNPGVTKPGVEISMHQYVRPGTENRELEKQLEEVFSGRSYEIRHPRSRSSLYHRVLIKDIYANLFAYWAKEKFPEIKPILIMRHPFAVAASKRNVQHWFHRSYLDELLSDECLIEDHLRDHLPMLNQVSNTDDFIIHQIAIWAIINSIPLSQFAAEGIHVVLYETLLGDTVDVLRDTLAFVESGSENSFPIPTQSLIDRPSSTTVHSDPGIPEYILPSEKPEKWKNLLTRKQIQWGVRILSEFGLARIYDDNPEPHLKSHTKIYHAIQRR